MSRYALLALTALALAVATLPAQNKKDLSGDPLPEGAVARMGSNRFRSDTYVSALALSPDGKTLVSGGSGNKLTFWNVATGKPARTVTLRTSTSVTEIEFSKDGKLLAVACSGSDSGVRIFDSSTGEEKKFLVDSTYRYNTYGIAFSPDGKTVVAHGRSNRTLLLWDVETATLKHRITNVASYSKLPIVFMPDSKQFLTQFNDSKLHLINVSDGKSARDLEPNVKGIPNSSSLRISALTLTPDAKQALYRIYGQQGLHIVNLANGKLVRTLNPPMLGYSYSSSLTMTPNGRFFIESSGSSSARIWGVASEKLLREVTGPAGGGSAQIALSRDGKRLAMAGGNVLSVIDIATSKPIHGETGHTSSVQKLAFSNDGKKLISMDSMTARVWDVASSRELHQTRGISLYGVNYLSANDKSARWVNSSDRGVYQWVYSEAYAQRLTTPGSTTYLYNQAISRDGKLLAGINSSDRKVRLIDLQGGKADKELVILPNYYGNLFTFSPDSRVLAVSNQNDRVVTLYDVATGVEVRKLMPSTTSYYGAPKVDFAPDGKSLWKYDGEPRIVEVSTGGERVRLPRETMAANQTEWSNDGRLLASAYSSGLVTVFDTYTGKELFRKETDQGSLGSIALSHDNKYLATGGANTTVMVWELPALPKYSAGGMTQEKAWKGLEGSDSAQGFAALVYFINNPDEAVKVIKEQIKPKAGADPKLIAKLIKDLDDDAFAVREKASEGLAEIGAAAQAALQEALQDPPSLEVKRRAEDLLRKIKGGASVPPDRLRALRAVEVLDRIGSDAAREVLKGLAKQKLPPDVEAAVKTSLARMKKD